MMTTKLDEAKLVVIQRLQEGFNLAQIADELRVSPHAVAAYVSRLKDEGLIEGDGRTSEGLVVDGKSVTFYPDKLCRFPSCEDWRKRGSMGLQGSYCERHERAYARRRAELAVDGIKSYGYDQFEMDVIEGEIFIEDLLSSAGLPIVGQRDWDGLEKLFYLHRASPAEIGIQKRRVKRWETLGWIENLKDGNLKLTRTGVNAIEKHWGDGIHEVQPTQKVEVIEPMAIEGSATKSNGHVREEVKLIEDTPAARGRATPSPRKPDDFYFDVGGTGLSIRVDGDMNVVRHMRQDKLFQIFRSVAEMIDTLRTAARDE